ncbi:hypothetical protein SAMN04487764_1513 [Gillisia sp. Hel1_33_143]|uniref:hypothetical protein n=1 Tax=Gillisia sp. Hel1_33_143 TaxID=1336796 RepID=UPI00087AB913|nr:hypothetical protein [Gillisia sp. Hel1_33_143]SDS12617.1 hypothetical protein SAMN04487764_1513 [Gillisia sp. Hel1_33_143]
MKKAFTIAPGRYDIPEIGKVDSRLEVSDEKAFSIYRLNRRVFPWIKLGPGAGSFLKKQKLTVKEIVSLVANARTAEEIEILASLTESKTVAGIVDVRLKALKN